MMGLTQAYLAAKKCVEAVSTAKQAMHQYSRRAEPLVLMGKVLAYSGQQRGASEAGRAAKAYRTALTLDRHNAACASDSSIATPFVPCERVDVVGVTIGTESPCIILASWSWYPASDCQCTPLLAEAHHVVVYRAHRPAFQRLRACSAAAQ
eukprot:3672-Heterococcus_DN1.PRE.3